MSSKVIKQQNNMESEAVENISVITEGSKLNQKEIFRAAVVELKQKGNKNMNFVT